MGKICILMLAVAFATVGSWCFSQAQVSQGDPETITVSCEIPYVPPIFTISLSKIIANPNDPTGGSDIWREIVGLEMDFGRLSLDDRQYINPQGVKESYNIFRTGSREKDFTDSFYFALDVGVIASSTAKWQIKHSPTSIQSGSADLNDNINVVYAWVQKKGNSSADFLIDRKSFGSSFKIIDSDDPKRPGPNSWLRIYYGIASGVKEGNAEGRSPDAPGVVPISIDKPPGRYFGKITLTLLTK